MIPENILPSDLMSEEKAYADYGHLFAERELREARKRGEISFFDLRKGPHYTPLQIMQYLFRRLKPACPANAPLRPEEKSPASSSSADTGSAAKSGRPSSTVIGMTPSLERRAASLLEAET